MDNVLNKEKEMNCNSIFQIAAFTVGLFFIIVNLVRLYYKQTVPFLNFALMTAGIVTYIALHWPYIFQNVG